MVVELKSTYAYMADPLRRHRGGPGGLALAWADIRDFTKKGPARCPSTKR